MFLINHWTEIRNVSSLIQLLVYRVCTKMLGCHCFWSPCMQFF